MRIRIMGLFMTYLAYRHGKKKAERKAARNQQWEHFDDFDTCDSCGFEMRFHADDDSMTCPE